MKLTRQKPHLDREKLGHPGQRNIWSKKPLVEKIGLGLVRTMLYAASVLPMVTVPAIVADAQQDSSVTSQLPDTTENGRAKFSENDKAKFAKFFFTMLTSGARDSLLLDAVEKGWIKKVERLLKEGYDIEARDGFGRSMLMCAAAEGHTEMVALLLKNGAVVDALQGYEANGNRMPILCGYGQTPLMYAAGSGYTETVALLLEYGADANARDEVGGETALMHAASLGHTETAALLLKKGAKIDTKDCMGMNALMHAARQGNVKTVALLLKNGADANAIDNHGTSVLEHASAWGLADSLTYARIAKLLRSADSLHLQDSIGK